MALAWVTKVQKDTVGAGMDSEPHQAAPLGHVVEDGLGRPDVVIDAGLPRERPLAPHHAHPAQAQPGGPCFNLHPPAGQDIIRVAPGGPSDDSIPSTMAQSYSVQGLQKRCCLTQTAAGLHPGAHSG